MTDDDSVDDLIHLMTEFWGIMEPEKPNLVISVVGGAKNFKLNGRMRDTFATGLIKVCEISCHVETIFQIYRVLNDLSLS